MGSLIRMASAALKFGYDAVVAKAKRQAPTGICRSEDAELDPSQRRQLLSASRDINRNFVIASWMVRRHLDFVTTFRFQARSIDAALNKKLEDQFYSWSQASQFDAARRHPLRRFIRLAEARAVLDGDVFLYRLADGRVQAIEGDRVRSPIGQLLPDGLTARDIVHGIHTDEAGGLKSICVCSRTKTSDFSPSAGGFVFERLLDAVHVHQHGYFDRFDQVRGISPLACALNSLRDSYEGIDYALAKMKIAQLFGLAFFRGDPDAINAADRPENTTDYKAMKLDGPKILDLDVGDRVEWLESKTPSMEFQAFQTLVIQLALKALDLPYSFFNESFTNYSGSRGARLLYAQSCKNRQADVVDLLDWLTRWRLAWLLAAGDLTEGEYLAANWEWVHASMPGLDPLKEIEADLRRLAAGMTTRRRLCKEQGEDYDEIKRELAEEQADLAELGLPTNVQPDNGLIKELVTDGAA